MNETLVIGVLAIRTPQQVNYEEKEMNYDEFEEENGGVHRMQADEKAWYDYEYARAHGTREEYCKAWWVYVSARQQVCLECEIEAAERAAGWSASP